MKELFEYLRSIGFSDFDGSESEHYVRLRVECGVIEYGWEFQLFSFNGWENPTVPGFYMWSGLGDRDSYGLFVATESVDEAKAILSGLLP